MKTHFTLLLLFIFCSLCLNGFGQETFVKRIIPAGTGGDINIATAKNGDCIISQNIKGDSGYISDLYCIRLNKNGKKIWEKVYNSSQSSQQQYNKMVATSDNGFFIFLKTYDYSLKEHAGMVLKCDSMGTVIWSKKIIGTPGNSYFDGIQAIEDTNGNYLIMYATFSFYVTQKLQIIKFDKNGEIISQMGWDNIYDESTYQNFNPVSIIQTQSKGYVISISYDCAWCQTGPRTYLLYADKDGNVISYKRYAPNHPYYYADNPVKMIKSKGQYFLLGYLETWDTEESKYYYYVSPIDKNGIPEKASLVNNDIYAIQKFLNERQLDFSTVFRTTYTKKSMTSYSFYGDYISGYGLLVGKYDSIGRICPDFSLPKYEYDTSSVSMYVGEEIERMTKFIDTITLTDKYIKVTDVDFTKTNCSEKIPSIASTTSSQNISLTKAVVVFPNPAKSTITVSFKSVKTGNAYVHISGIDGKTVQSVKVNSIKGMNMQSINISSLAKGIYFIKIMDGDKQTVLKFLKE